MDIPWRRLLRTAEIAKAFDNGMEYFNTFGGNPVSCGIGLSVLEVLENEKLQIHAHEVGEYFKQNLLKLQKEFSIIGDIRGRGLFLGIELVKNLSTLEPAAEEAALIVENMKEEGILVKY